MPRIKKEVDEYILKMSVEEAEKDGEFSNLSNLWQAVANIYNQKVVDSKSQITDSVAMLRVKELKINYKTKPGKRGRSKSNGFPLNNSNVNRTTKSEKFESSQDHRDWLDTIKKNAPTERFKTMVDQCREKGSRTIALKLKCLECSGWSTTEVRKCPVKSCALWGFRPYQGKIEDEELDNESEISKEEQLDEE